MENNYLTGVTLCATIPDCGEDYRITNMDELTYEEVLFQIENEKRFGKLVGVEVSKRMLLELSYPQRGMKIIHVAGTNGKGSVSAFLCSILKEAGLKTGMFVSPHLVAFEERIQVNGTMISREDVRRLGSLLLHHSFTVSPTMFDYCLMMAVLYFKEQNCDVVVIETGLGGKLDSTNALGVPVVSVITAIGYDHMAILGDTLTKIASEKAGIIKAGTKLIMEEQEPEAMQVLLNTAERMGISDYKVVAKEDMSDMKYKAGAQSFSYRNYTDITMHLIGVHQYENAAAAILAAEAFFDVYFNCKADKRAQEEWILNGISKTRWQGRMEILMEKPFLLIDGAHNGNGVLALQKSLCQMFPGEQFHFIMGVMADKDYEKMIEELIPLAIDFKTITVESSRALQASDLASCIRAKGVPAVSCDDMRSCFLPENLDKNQRTIAFGSLYFIGEIERIINEKHLN